MPTVADLSEGHHRKPKYKRSTLKSYVINVTKCKWQINLMLTIKIDDIRWKMFGEETSGVNIAIDAV